MERAESVLGMKVQLGVFTSNEEDAEGDELERSLEILQREVEEDEEGFRLGAEMGRIVPNDDVLDEVFDFGGEKAISGSVSTTTPMRSEDGKFSVATVEKLNYFVSDTPDGKRSIVGEISFEEEAAKLDELEDVDEELDVVKETLVSCVEDMGPIGLGNVEEEEAEMKGTSILIRREVDVLIVFRPDDNLEAEASKILETEASTEKAVAQPSELMCTQANISALERNNADFRESNTALRLQLEALQAKLETQESEIESLKSATAAVPQIESAVENKSAHIQTEELQKADRGVQTLGFDDSLRISFADLQGRFAKLEHQNIGLQNKLDEAIDMKKKLEAQVQQMDWAQNDPQYRQVAQNPPEPPPQQFERIKHNEQGDSTPLVGSIDDVEESRQQEEQILRKMQLERERLVKAKSRIKLANRETSRSLEFAANELRSLEQARLRAEARAEELERQMKKTQRDIHLIRSSDAVSTPMSVQPSLALDEEPAPLEDEDMQYKIELYPEKKESRNQREMKENGNENLRGFQIENHAPFATEASARDYQNGFSLLERKLMIINLERDKCEAELSKLANKGVRTREAIQMKADTENHLRELEQQAQNVRIALKNQPK